MSSTLQFIGRHNEVAEMHRTRAQALYRDSVRALARANETADPITRVWFEQMAESYAAKSDDSFARALEAARGVL